MYVINNVERLRDPVLASSLSFLHRELKISTPGKCGEKFEKYSFINFFLYVFLLNEIK